MPLLWMLYSFLNLTIARRELGLSTGSDWKASGESSDSSAQSDGQPSGNKPGKKSRDKMIRRLLAAVFLLIATTVVGTVVYTNYTLTDAYKYTQAEKCIEQNDYIQAS